jgi:spermidine/putrescine transport system permease protein
LKKKLLNGPYLAWMLLFAIAPLFIVVWYALTAEIGGERSFSLANLQRVFEPIYLRVIWHSLKLAVISTFLCFLLGYPAALILASRPFRRRTILVVLIVLPMWMNFLARTYAWLSLLEKNGVINSVLAFLGLPALNILYTDAAVVLGMVYNFLPFMILPIYSVLYKIDHSQIEAAQDLGATPLITFQRVIFPQSLAGALSGVVMVFMPAMTTFVISRLLGGGQYTLIGNLIEQQFLTTYDWGFGSALSLFLMALLIVMGGLLMRSRGDNEGGLW